MVLYKAHEGIISGHNARKTIAQKVLCILDCGGHHCLKRIRSIASTTTFTNRPVSHQDEMNYHSLWTLYLSHLKNGKLNLWGQSIPWCIEMMCGISSL
jgi:hypothetical protein